jgi:asparagine N-glycosylation enzyme membrane subunit Stt3
VAIVRVLLFAALAIIAAALLLYALKRDRRYLRFVGQVIKFTIFALLAILVGFALQRILGFSLSDAFRAAIISPPVRSASPALERLLEGAIA